MFDKIKKFLKDNKDLIIEKGVVIAGVVLGTIIAGVIANKNPEETADVVIDIVQE